MKNKKLYSLVAVICIILIILIGLVVKDKKLALDSELVTDLYSYLGEVDVYHCGGLFSYSGSKVTVDNLSKSNMLCLAYHNLEDSKINQEESNVTGKNDNNQDICKVGEEINILAEEEQDTCKYTTFTKQDLNKRHQEMFGKEITEYNNFYTSISEICSLEEETYYCGDAETYNYSLGTDAMIYRLPNKAIKQSNGDIIIYDYFLRVVDDTCYKTNSNDNEDSECTKNLNKATIDEEFVQKNGTLYKHTYKKSKDSDNYYWYSSEMK